eukprot:TRINITY_DN6448_c0_g1_i16.p1 TRINITY_DN6448_c0_g1~~TRINITY_DN6448_c0_g1_i16.p1  ORF type:complete len:592 (-),score=159.20 TRINITY_DN6448_c0_g1_i16:147-1862(-)
MCIRDRVSTQSTWGGINAEYMGNTNTTRKQTNTRRQPPPTMIKKLFGGRTIKSKKASEVPQPGNFKVLGSPRYTQKASAHGSQHQLDNKLPPVVNANRLSGGDHVAVAIKARVPLHTLIGEENIVGKLLGTGEMKMRKAVRNDSAYGRHDCVLEPEDESMIPEVSSKIDLESRQISDESASTGTSANNTYHPNPNTLMIDGGIANNVNIRRQYNEIHYNHNNGPGDLNNNQRVFMGGHPNNNNNNNTGPVGTLFNFASGSQPCLSLKKPTEAEKKALQRKQLTEFSCMYEKEYGDMIEKTMLENQPDYSDAYAKTSITPALRAKMLDWMMEVFGNYPSTTTNYTYFLSMHLLDMFCKKCKSRRLRDSDVHLLGVVCMFMASKYEDVYHITLNDFVERVAHKKFSAEQIKEREWEILRALNFNVGIPSTLYYLEKNLYKYFGDDPTNALAEIKLNSIYLLKMCYFDIRFLKYKPYLFSLSIMFYTVKSFFAKMADEVKNDKMKAAIIEQENIIIHGVVSEIHVSVEEIEGVLTEIRHHVLNFDSNYKDFKNLAKYAMTYADHHTSCVPPANP